MRAAEWIALIRNEDDRKYARAACMEVLAEASAAELLEELQKRAPLKLTVLEETPCSTSSTSKSRPTRSTR